MEEALRRMNLEFCGSSEHKITLDKLWEVKDAFFLDVRDEAEVRALRFDLEMFGIPTKNIPIHQLPDRVNELPKDRLIVCFCSSGTRSAWAYIYLFSQGFRTKWLEATNAELAAALKPGKVLKAVK
jgi:rhodanese-related sulfurtransferase